MRDECCERQRSARRVRLRFVIPSIKTKLEHCLEPRRRNLRVAWHTTFFINIILSMISISFDSKNTIPRQNTLADHREKKLKEQQSLDFLKVVLYGTVSRLWSFLISKMNSCNQSSIIWFIIEFCSLHTLYDYLEKQSRAIAILGRVNFYEAGSMNRIMFSDMLMSVRLRFL